MNTTLTAVEGLLVGHYTDTEAMTGCTVVLCPEGTVGGVDVRGSAPGTRETDLLNPINLVPGVHGVLLTGGSAYGLAAAAGVMRWLEEHNIGFPVGVGLVPIVPGAVLFDLAIGRADVRPGPTEGYAACEAATDQPVPEGSVGAGTGATIGKIFGPQYSSKGGIGSAVQQLNNGVMVAALVVVNAFGDVVHPQTGEILAGACHPDGSGFVNTLAYFQTANLSGTPFAPAQNTTLAVVATDAKLTKVSATKMAQMAHDGLAQTIRPGHTMYDGDTIFALGTGKSTQTVDTSVLGSVAAAVLAKAVIRAVEMK